MSGHELIAGRVDGLDAVIVVAVVDESDSPRAREGVARRRLVAITGACPCGAVAVLPSRAQRRAARAAGRATVADVAHELGCPAVEPYGARGSR